MSNISVKKMEILAEKIDAELQGRDPAAPNLEDSLKAMLIRYAFYITQHNAETKGAYYPNKYDPDQIEWDEKIINAPIISEHGLFRLEYRREEAPVSGQTFLSLVGR